MQQTVDKRLVQTRFRRRLGSYGDYAEMQSEMARQLIAGLTRIKGRHFPRALEIGCGAGTLTRLIAEKLDIELLHVNDMIDECRAVAEKETRSATAMSVHFVKGDIEADIPMPSRLDLILSNATFQWLEDLNALLPHLASLLGDRGALAFSTFGPENLREIRELTGAGLVYLPASAIEDLLHRDFHILHRTEGIIPLQFASPLDVIKHLRGTGGNAIRKERWDRSTLDRFISSYRDRWGASGMVPLTYHPMTFIAEKKQS